jgi:hypothetical protein
MSTSPGPTHHSEPGAIHIDTQGDLQNVAALTPSSTPGSDVHMQPEPREPSHGLSGSYPVPVSNSLEAFYPEIDETGPINPIRSQPGLSENLQPLEPIVDGEHSAPIDQGLAIPTPRSATTANSQSYSGRSKSVYAVLPTHLLPTCPLDEILLDFLSSHKDMLSKGVALETVVGPEKPTAKAFLNPELSSSVHSISRVLSEVLLTFPYVHQPEKLAFFYVMHKTMRVGDFI